MGKFCKNQKEGVVKKITAILNDVPADQVDEVVGLAKTRLDETSKQAEREDLEKLFDRQIQTLQDRGCPEQIVEILKNQRTQVIEKAREMTFAEGNIPFLPVISGTYLSVYSQMSMVEKGSQVGYSYLKPTLITDVVETPKDPYYIFDVEDGQAMRGKSPLQAEKLIKKQDRRCLTVFEVIALGIHTDVLSGHYVDATGSRFVLDEVPNLCLNGGKAGLDCDCAVSGSGMWGSASCGSN